MRTVTYNTCRVSRIFLNGAPVDLPERRFLGRALLDAYGEPGRPLGVSEATPPYLFCGNGSCRDCNMLVEGLSAIPTCRVPLAPGLSVRTDADTAIARRLPEPAAFEPLVADVVVVGGGPAGRAVPGAEVLEARAPDARPVSVEGGRLVVLDGGRKRPIEARRVVLATGARDVVPPRADVLPLDLFERYAGLGALALESPSPRLVLLGEEGRVEALHARLRELGAESVQIASAKEIPPPDPGGVVYAVGTEREPSLELARALGCRTRYDRERGSDVLVLSETGETSVGGVFAAGDVAASSRRTGGDHDPS